jgi:hypothetical protein
MMFSTEGAAILPSKNDPESQPPDLFSSVETRAMLEEFRELVRAGILRVTPENEVLPVKPPEGDEGQTPASREEDVAQLDKQLLEWMERRREQRTAEAGGEEPGKSAEQAPETMQSGMRQKVVDRIAQKILDTWDRSDPASDRYPRLREQVVERVAEEILRRWQRNLD